jgi:thiamine biosynthesis lipoprotein ApbE
MRGRHNGIGKLPNSADRILKRSVSIEHDLVAFTVSAPQTDAANRLDKLLTVAREELYALLCRLVGTAARSSH